MGPLSVISTGLNVVGSIMGGNAESAQARQEASIAAENARRAREAAGQIRLAGQNAEQAKRREIRRSLGRTAAAASQAGVGGPGYGSMGAVLKQASAEGEFDAQNVRYGYQSDAYAQELEALNQDAAAQAARRRSRQAKTMGYINAASAAIGGIASYSRMKSQMPRRAPRAPQTSATKVKLPSHATRHGK